MNKVYLSLSFLLLLFSCADSKTSNIKAKTEPEPDNDTTMTVTATAFNTLEYQTTENPHLTAWQDTLRPGINAIAVSRDLLALGLDHNKEVKIKGLPGTYLVKDKMAARWNRKIDIYMGERVDEAEQWGEQELEITFTLPEN